MLAERTTDKNARKRFNLHARRDRIIAPGTLRQGPMETAPDVADHSCDADTEDEEENPDDVSGSNGESELNGNYGTMAIDQSGNVTFIGSLAASAYLQDLESLNEHDLWQDLAQPRVLHRAWDITPTPRGTLYLSTAALH